MKQRFAICRLDFDIWDAVLVRVHLHAPGMRLETFSRADDRRDARLMHGWQCQEMETLSMSRLERLRWLGIGD
jgi:hypothetical protein